MAKRVFNVMGVDVEFDPDVANDARFVYLLGSFTGAGADANAAASYSRLCDLMFDDPLDVLNRLAEKRGGIVTNEEFAEFINGVLSKAALKNSQRSQ